MQEPAVECGFFRFHMPVRAVLFSYYELDNLPRLLGAIDASGMPGGTRVHVGSYGVSAEASSLIRSSRGGRFAPMFKATERTAGWSADASRGGSNGS